jgi:hypothetical protein
MPVPLYWKVTVLMVAFTAVAQLYIGIDQGDPGSPMRGEPPSVRLAAPYRREHPTTLPLILTSLSYVVPAHSSAAIRQLLICSPEESMPEGYLLIVVKLSWLILFTTVLELSDMLNMGRYPPKSMLDRIASYATINTPGEHSDDVEFVGMENLAPSARPGV